MTATVLTPADLRDDVEALAKAIAGDDADVSRIALARQIAAAQLDLMRVQVAKVALMNSQLWVISPVKQIEAEVAAPSEDAHTDVLIPSIDILHQLARLERYERRAIARYRRAARGFVTHQRA